MPNTTKNNLYVYDNRFNVDVLYSSMSNLFAGDYDFCVYIYTDILRFFVRVFGFTLIQNRTGAIWAPYGDHMEIVRRYIRQNTSHVKNPTEFLTPIFAENHV